MKLSIKKHIEHLSRKGFAAKELISPYIHVSNPLPHKTRIGPYRVYVQSTILYAASSWNSTTKCQLQELQTLENSCLRLILRKNCLKISIETLYMETNHRPLQKKVKNLSTTFFEGKLQRHQSTRNIDTTNKHNDPFRAKHKLVNDILHRQH